MEKDLVQEKKLIVFSELAHCYQYIASKSFFQPIFFSLEILATIRSQTLKREHLKGPLESMKFFSQAIVWRMFNIRCSKGWIVSKLCKCSY